MLCLVFLNGKPNIGCGVAYFCGMRTIGLFIMAVWVALSCPLSYSQGVALSDAMKRNIKEVEGLSLEVYMDGFYRAVGYGHRITDRDPEWIYDLVEYDEITPETADILFELDMIHLVAPGLQEVVRDIGTEYPQNVYDVMGSLIYNMGLAGLRDTAFYRLFKSKDYELAFRELLATKSGKDGLLNRRFMELKVLTENYSFVQGCYTKTEKPE